MINEYIIMICNCLNWQLIFDFSADHLCQWVRSRISLWWGQFDSRGRNIFFFFFSDFSIYHNWLKLFQLLCCSQNTEYKFCLIQWSNKILLLLSMAINAIEVRRKKLHKWSCLNWKKSLFLKKISEENECCLSKKKIKITQSFTVSRNSKKNQEDCFVFQK
jgi:hypothetical protein